MASDRGRLSDEKLRLQLARRSSTPLLGTPRDDLLASISRQAASTPHAATGWAGLRGRVLHAVAAAAAVVVLLAVVLQLPRDGAMPPGSSAEPRVLSAQELTDLAHQQFTGVVVADISSADVRVSRCRPALEPCWTITLAEHDPPLRFAVVHDAEPDPTLPAAVRLVPGDASLPSAAHYLGPVRAAHDSLAWTVARLLDDLHDGDQLHMVDGWLVASPAHSCRAPTLDYWLDETTASEDRSGYWLSEQTLDYWCPGEWITDRRAELARFDSAGNMTGVQQPDPPFLQVQAGAYSEFTDGLRADIPPPQHGYYLVRSAGCPPAVWGGECPVWQVVGRLSEPHVVTPPPAPGSPSPPPTPVAAPPAMLSPDPGGAELRVDARGNVVCWTGAGCRISLVVEPAPWTRPTDWAPQSGDPQFGTGGFGRTPIDGPPTGAPSSLPPGRYTLAVTRSELDESNPDAYVFHETVCSTDVTVDSATRRVDVQFQLDHPCRAEVTYERSPAPPAPPADVALYPATDPPGWGQGEGHRGTWHGHRVRLCNEDQGGRAFTYVAGDSRLGLADGSAVAAWNGVPDPFRGDGEAPPWWPATDDWLDKATLYPGDCVEGWLIFGVTSDAEPQWIEWYGGILELPVVLPDDIPAEVDGRPVLRPDDALSWIDGASDDAPFLVGGMVSRIVRYCWEADDFPRSPLLGACEEGYVNEDYYIGPIRLATDQPLDFAGPLVVQVHVNDPRAAECPPDYRERCRRAAVLESVVWSADAPPIGATLPATLHTSCHLLNAWVDYAGVTWVVHPADSGLDLPRGFRSGVDHGTITLFTLDEAEYTSSGGTVIRLVGADDIPFEQALCL